uniref:Uncharacterized protein n=1 Tax=Amphimedon queenslandica TaxID=400682 RepID=A0A1X7TTW7_AMPQE
MTAIPIHRKRATPSACAQYTTPGSLDSEYAITHEVYPGRWRRETQSSYFNIVRTMKFYYIHQSGRDVEVTDESNASTTRPSIEPPLKKFRFLSQMLMEQQDEDIEPVEDRNELHAYMQLNSNKSDDDPLIIWTQTPTYIPKCHL